ncbi:MAG: NAD-dependent epimerase/dehydratase family protein, partial [Gammaproteobacteria bacterium]
MDLSGEQVVVTGACGALGRAVCARAAALGARVIGLDIVRADVPGCSAVHAVDLGDAAATSTCIAGLGRVDALFNVAGGFAM